MWSERQSYLRVPAGLYLENPDSFWDVFGSESWAHTKHVPTSLALKIYLVWCQVKRNININDQHDSHKAESLTLLRQITSWFFNFVVICFIFLFHQQNLLIIIQLLSDIKFQTDKPRPGNCILSRFSLLVAVGYFLCFVCSLCFCDY